MCESGHSHGKWSSLVDKEIGACLVFTINQSNQHLLFAKAALLGVHFRNVLQGALYCRRVLWIPVKERNLTLWERLFVNISLVSCFFFSLCCEVTVLTFLVRINVFFLSFFSFSLNASSVVTFFLPTPVCRKFPLLILHHFSPPSNNPISVLWAGRISSSQTPSNTNHVTTHWAD